MSTDLLDAMLSRRQSIYEEVQTQQEMLSTALAELREVSTVAKMDYLERAMGRLRVFVNELIEVETNLLQQFASQSNPN